MFLYSRFPFEWKTPFAFAIACLIQCPTIYYLMLTGCCCIDFLIGPCMMFITFAKDIKRNLNFLDKNKQNCAIVLKHLRAFVQFHVQIEQLSTNDHHTEIKLKSFCFRFFFDFIEMTEFIHTSFFLWSITTICSTLLMLQNGIVEYKITLRNCNKYSN